MRTTHKAVPAGALCAAALVAALGVSGCTSMSEMHVDANAGTVDMQLHATAYQDEVEAVLKPLLLKRGMTDSQAQAWLADLPQNAHKIPGFYYGKVDGTGAGVYTFTRDIGSVEVGPGKGIVADSDKFVVYDSSALRLDNLLEAPAADASQLGDDFAAEAWEKLLADGTWCKVKVWLGDGVTPLETDMRKLSCCEAYGYSETATVSDLGNTAGRKLAKPIYAQLTQKSVDATAVTADVENGVATRSKSVVLDTDGVISSVTVNGAALGATDKVQLGADGKKDVQVTLVNGAETKLSFTKDTAKPYANVKMSSVLKKGKKLLFGDKTSGVKKATLNGKRVKSGKKVSKAGTYKLVVTDKAGNKATFKFKVK